MTLMNSSGTAVDWPLLQLNSAELGKLDQSLSNPPFLERRIGEACILDNPDGGAKMRFMLLSHDDEKAWDKAGEAALQRGMQEAVALTHRIDAAGQYILAAPLQPSGTAVNVRVRDGKTHVTDGPYAETHEVVGGFYLVNVPSIEDAIKIAQQHPGARFGTVEIRAVRELDGLPTPRLS